MFGPVSDLVISLIEDRRGGIPDNVIIRKKNNPESKTLWVMFFPTFVYNNKYLNSRITSIDSSVYVYTIPKTAVQPDPIKTRDLLRKILDTSIEDVKNSDLKFEKINVLGISIGNCLSYKFATKIEVDVCVSAIPGSYLPESIFESISTKSIASCSAVGLKEYQDVLREFNPIDSLKEMTAKKIEVYLARWDKMIPYRRGKELADAIILQKFNASIKTYWIASHSDGVFYFARDFSKKYSLYSQK
jgi:hypothetical protein